MRKPDKLQRGIQPQHRLNFNFLTSARKITAFSISKSNLNLVSNPK